MVRRVILAVLEDLAGCKGISLDPPANSGFGDYATNIAIVLAKEKKEDPRAFANKLAAKLNDGRLNKIVEKIVVAGPGFVNFFLKTDILIDNLIEIDKKKEKYGGSDIGRGKVIVVDYSSPNIAKPFGIGHLRSTIIGQSLVNLYRFLGYEVIGDNHLGDWGTQFGKLLFKLQDFSAEEIEKLTVADLEKLYVNFHKEAAEKPEIEEEARIWFKKLEEGDAKARKLWQICVNVSLKEFNRIYEKLNVKIDYALGESYYQAEMRALINNPQVKNQLLLGEKGAKIINLEKAGFKVPLMFLKKDGATTYATRDLATIVYRVRKWQPSLIIYEVGNEQTFYFKQIFAAARLLKLVPESTSLVHTAHGLYLAPDGKKFSTREGKTVKLDEVLKEAVRRAEKLGNTGKIAEEVGIGAIKYFDLMHGIESNVVFNWEKMMNLTGNSGPYLQYTVARINSVLAKTENKMEIVKKPKLKEEELIILRTLVHFGEVVEKAALHFAPNVLCNYLYDLALKFNCFYSKNRIINSKDEVFRIKLSFATLQVLKNGLHLLGIETPEKM